MADVAERIYYGSPTLEFNAVVTDIRLDSRDESGQLWQVALDRTAFFPEGGGQPWDVGTLTATAKSGTTLEVPVERVEEDDAGEVWHFVRKPLVEGTEVAGLVDAARRQDHEQQHSGQHLLSAVFLRELAAKTVSFHMSAESSTIDVELPEGMKALSDADIERVETAANIIVAEGRPMMSHWVDREMAEAMLARGDLRKLPERTGPMRIVQMQGIEFNACGGTHVANTGAIGAVTIRRLEKVRQGWRVEFCCGLRAVRAARRDYDLLSRLAGQLSVAQNNVPDRVAGLLQEAKRSKKERLDLLDALANAEASSLAKENDEGEIVIRVFGDRDIEFAKRVASKLGSAGLTAVIGAACGDQGAVVFARGSRTDTHAGNFLRDALATAGSHGGGAAEIGQGSCAAADVPKLVETMRIALQ